MKSLRTTFPHGMNERSKNIDKKSDTPVWKSLFSPIPRSKKKSNRSRGNTGNFQEHCFYLEFNLIVLRKKLKKNASEIPKILHENSGDIHLDHLYFFILDIIDTKLFASETTTIKKSQFLNILYL